MTSQIPARVVALINGKGGVLKTTLTANIGGLLAANGFRVLLVDLDPQGNLAEDLGYTDSEANDGGVALASALTFGHHPAPLAGVRPNLDVLVGGPALDRATAALAADAQRSDARAAKLAVAHTLEPLKLGYDFILLDCPPGDETLQTAALAAARWALVPVKTDRSSRKGLAAVAARFEAVRDLNPDLQLLGVVLVSTGSSARAVQREARDHISALFGGGEVTFDATVRHSEATAQATREHGQLVHELDEQNQRAPKWYEQLRNRPAGGATRAGPRTAGSVADDLQSVTQEIVTRVSAAEQQEQPA